MILDSFDDAFRPALATLLMYPLLVVILRLSGKRTLSKLNAFDFVVTIALGSTLSSAILQRDVTVAEAGIALAALVVLQLGVSWTSVRNRVAQRLARSAPRLLVRDGVMLENAMILERVASTEVLQAIRQRGFGTLDEVAAVVLETDGSISVLGGRASELRVLEDVDGAGDVGGADSTT